MSRLVFTTESLGAALQHSSGVEWLSANAAELPVESQVVAVRTGHGTHFVRRGTSSAESRIVILDDDGVSLESLPPETARDALRRAHRAALSSQAPPLRLPFEWSVYHSGSLLAFFACARPLGAIRWVAQTNPFGTKDICFWRLTDQASSVLLEQFAPPGQGFDLAVAGWDQSLTRAQDLFAARPEPQRYIALDGAIDLRKATFGAVIGHLTYSGWLQELTEGQTRFVEHPTDHAVKLRGPAGTGKTLALALKALREVYEARKLDKSIRVLFATHSWAMAEQADQMLRQLDESGDLGEITVFPLFDIAHDLLPSASFAHHPRMLGTDSHSGRREQLRRLDDVLWRLRQGDWLAYVGGVSEDFRRRVMSERGSPVWNSLLWDLIHEVSSVIAASRILPGVTAEARYLSLQRAQWMMPLVNESERRFVLRAYSDYVAELRSEGLLTVDQLMSDLLSFLETFTWDQRRLRDGYDLVLVDELHLFSEAERQILNYLTRDATRFPRLFMALDPRQSPSEVYSDFPVESVALGESGVAERGLGTVDSVDLNRVHRFSPEILAFVQFIQRSYPTLGLGDDWLLDADALTSSAPNGAIPQLHRHMDAASERQAVSRSAKLSFAETKHPKRIAVVLLDSSSLDDYRVSLEAEDVPITVIAGRDDIDVLRYRKRSVVLAPAECVAGLQFDMVIVAGFPATDPRMSVHHKRRALSMLYLAVSRAAESVEIQTHMPSGEFLSFLELAATSGVLDSGGGRGG